MRATGLKGSEYCGLGEVEPAGMRKYVPSQQYRLQKESTSSEARLPLLEDAELEFTGKNVMPVVHVRSVDVYMVPLVAVVQDVRNVHPKTSYHHVE
jgi:hypothetical protein